MIRKYKQSRTMHMYLKQNQLEVKFKDIFFPMLKSKKDMVPLSLFLGTDGFEFLVGEGNYDLSGYYRDFPYSQFHLYVRAVKKVLHIIELNDSIKRVNDIITNDENDKEALRLLSEIHKEIEFELKELKRSYDYINNEFLDIENHDGDELADIRSRLGLSRSVLIGSGTEEDEEQKEEVEEVPIEIADLEEALERNIPVELREEILQTIESIKLKRKTEKENQEQEMNIFNARASLMTAKAVHDIKDDTRKRAR